MASQVRRTCRKCGQVIELRGHLWVPSGLREDRVPDFYAASVCLTPAGGFHEPQEARLLIPLSDEVKKRWCEEILREYADAGLGLFGVRQDQESLWRDQDHLIDDLRRSLAAREICESPPAGWNEGTCARCHTQTLVKGPPSQRLCVYCDELRVLPPSEQPVRKRAQRGHLMTMATALAAIGWLIMPWRPEWVFPVFIASLALWALNQLVR